MTDLSTLIERLEKVGGPDRELDAFIHCFAEYGALPHFEGNDLIYTSDTNPRSWLLGYIDPGKVQRNFSAAFMKPPLPAYTASIDAALALVERMLSGDAQFGRIEWGPETSSVEIRSDSSSRKTWGFGYRCDDRIAIAILIALLRALEAQEQSHD